jgi:glycosyltransferase involved in cell wall biosynthesis
MKILVVHQNFPGQFKHIVPRLLDNPNNEAVALAINEVKFSHPRLRVIRYTPTRGSTPNLHPWLIDTEAKVIRGQAAFEASQKLKATGFTPDLILAHPGWGESLFLKEVWPSSKLLIYCEFHYHSQGADVGFDPEFLSEDPSEPCRIRMKNANNIMHFDLADAALAPTTWQKSTFPKSFQEKISVIHDGIDTELICPKEDVRIKINERVITRHDEVITFINRNLEPYRGYHTFMRALPDVMAKRPNALVMIVGGDGVSYGKKAPVGKTWKQIFLDEVKEKIDLNRVFFLGKIPHSQLIALMQVSSLHVYLTYPFVLSWSLLEAMSCGCPILASDTAPLKEIITDNKTGVLTDFFSVSSLASRAVELLSDADKRQRLGRAARELIIEHYDLNTVCLPQLEQLIRSVAGR